MDQDQLRQLESDFDVNDSPTTKGGAGKSTLTSRLTPAPQMVFRVSDPETARALGESLSMRGQPRIMRDADAGAAGARDANGVSFGAEAAVDRAASSSGSALPAHLQRQFEGSLGADLSSVRVHTGSESAEAAHAVGAKAYTVGQDIHFAAGKYQPDDAFGMHLLAHEVAHTVQQSGGAQRRQHKLEVSAPQDAAEHEADRAADAMVRGAPAQVSGASGAQRVARIATEYSKDDDLKKLPPAPSFQAADGSFAAMAKAVAESMKGDGTGAVPSPTSGFEGSSANLIACRNNAESSQVYYSTHKKLIDPGNFNAQYAQIAQGDAEWAIGMMGDVRVAGSATGTWVELINSSNRAWASLVKLAESQSITVSNKQNKDKFTQEVTRGDQQINADDVGGSGNELAAMAKKAGLKAPDTSAYKGAMSAYTSARNKLAPEQQMIITSLIPTNVAAIRQKRQEAEDEKEKWETIAQATDAFEKGLTVAFGGAAFLDGKVMEVHTEEVDGEAQLKHPETDHKDIASKANGVLAKVIEIRIAALAQQVASYDTNLKSYTNVQEAMSLKGAIGKYKNALVELRDKATAVETERAKMAKALQEFAKSVDDALIKKGAMPKDSKNAQNAAALLAAIKTASTTTDGAVQALTSGGAADLGGLYTGLATAAKTRNADQTGPDGRRDPRSAVFGIESARWSAASRAVSSIGGDFGRRKEQIAALEAEFMTQFESASGGTDSIK